MKRNALQHIKFYFWKRRSILVAEMERIRNESDWVKRLIDLKYWNAAEIDLRYF